MLQNLEKPYSVYNKSLFNLIHQPDIQTFIQINLDSQQFRGYIQETEKTSTLRLFKGEEYQALPLSEQLIPEGSFYLSESSSNSINLLPKALQLGDISGITGQIAGFIENPYQSDITWAWKSYKRSKTEVVEQLLQDLATYYPQAIEITLPDGSNILELQRLTEVFVTEDSDERTLLTHPDGQIEIKKVGGELRILSGVKQYPEEKMSHSCYSASSELSGQLLSPISEGFMWTNIFFSYSSQEIAFCYSLDN